jgi:hypothetical protein
VIALKVLQPASASVTASDGADAFSLAGHVGIWSSAGGNPVHLIGGTEFTYPGGTLTQAPGSYQGVLTNALRAIDGCGVDAFVTDATLPEGSVLRGRFVRASFGPYHTPQLDNGSYPWGIEQQTGFTQVYRIEHVLVQDGKTYIVLNDDPALLFENDVVYETKRPYRSFTGPVSFEITLSRTE